MKFWIVTPSFQQIEWLRFCVASVADQVAANANRSSAEGAFTVHHHVQDACSTDGTVDFLQAHQASRSGLPGDGYTFSYESATDNGMYDAINRGWKLAPDDVDVFAHLNCDEQYLPAALQTIAAFFASHPETDVVLADMIVVDGRGDYVCHRRSLKPYALLSKYCSAGMTATVFHRSAVTRKKQVYFDPNWRNFGDKVWYNDLHKAGCTFGVYNRIVSVFTDTGENLNWTQEGYDELARYNETILAGKPFPSRIIAKLHASRRLLKELFLSPPRHYELYAGEPTRTRKDISHPTAFWHKKWRPP